MRAWNKLLMLNNDCQPETMSCVIEIVECTLNIGSELSLSAADIQSCFESDKDA